jgi:putative oxidoreductase
MRRWLYPDSVSVLGSAGLLLLRVPVGLAFLVHGWPKIQNPFGWMGPEVSVPAILQFFAAVAEFGGGLLLLPGLLTRIAGAGVAATMVGAMVLYHIPVGSPFIGVPGQASYELVIVYLACGLLLFLSGAGRYSADRLAFGIQVEPQQAPSHWQLMYGSRNVIGGRVVQDVTEHLEARGNGARNQAADNAVFEPLANATVVAIGQGDYGFAIAMFRECYALAREFENNNACEIHKGAMTFNVAVAYLRANDFAAAMHYFELAQIETQLTTADPGWGIYDSGLFQQNYWNILNLFEQQQPLPLYNTFWGTAFGAAAARDDWGHLSDHSKLLYVMLNAERISYRRLSAEPHMAVSDSFGLAYWNLIADLTRLLETEIRFRGIAGGGLQAQILYHVLNSPIAGFHGIVQGAGSLNALHPVNSPALFNAHFPAIRTIISDPAETRERRIAAAAYLAGITRNQVQHQVDTTMVLFTDRAAAIFTAEVLLCLCRIDAWVA